METAILIIAHGAPESEEDDSAVRNRERLAERTGMDVYIGYLHLEPSIGSAIGRMLDEGVQRIIAVPLFVFPGFLPDVSVRKAMGLEPGAALGTVSIGGRSAQVLFTGTFADHPLMENVLTDVCAGHGVAPKGTSVMLIYHGNRSGSGSENVDRCSGYLTAKGFETVSAYNEFQSPTVQEALESLMGSGKDILAIPMFVSPGSHTVSDIPPKLGLEGGRIRDIGDGRRVIYAEEIGMHPMIADILEARISEVSGQ